MFQRVILAIDDSDAGWTSTSFAIALAKSGGAPGVVHVIHVNEYLAGGRGFTVETEEEASEIVHRAVEDLQSAGVHATGATLRATSFSLAATITHAAQDWGADVIVVGSHRRRHLGFLFGRGVRERLARTSLLPVFVAPPPLDLRKRIHPVRPQPDRRPRRTSVSP